MKVERSEEYLGKVIVVGRHFVWQWTIWEVIKFLSILLPFQGRRQRLSFPWSALIKRDERMMIPVLCLFDATLHCFRFVHREGDSGDDGRKLRRMIWESLDFRS